MPSPIRIYYPSPVEVQGQIFIEGEEHHYLTRVHRAHVGDKVVLFGHDLREREGVIESIVRGRSTIQLASIHESQTEPAMMITLAIAVGKGRKLEEIVETATALGVSKIVPFVSVRSVAKRSHPDLVDKLRKVAIEACRQSRRVQVPEIGEVLTGLSKALANVQEPESEHFFLDEAGGRDLVEIALQIEPEKKIVLFIGPEGGWDDSERGLLLNSGARPANLGPRILRTELASIVAVSILERISAYKSTMP